MEIWLEYNIARGWHCVGTLAREVPYSILGYNRCYHVCNNIHTQALQNYYNTAYI